MSNYVPFNQNQTYQPYQATQYFPQPQGSIYMIANSNDIANVPVGAGLSAAICLREGVMYLKTIQNGSPMLLAYKLMPLENGDGQVATQTQIQESGVQDKKIIAILEDYDKRLKALESQTNSKSKIQTQSGGNPEWPTI